MKDAIEVSIIFHEGQRMFAVPKQPAPVQESTKYSEWIETACALIKAADDAAADRDYMLDSDDCIAVLRGTWKAPLANDMPKQPAPPTQPAPVQEPVVMPENWFSGMPEEYRKEAWKLTTPPAQPAVPDAITDDSESPEYRTGWNDCRQAMMEMMK
jgi:hypothetical protein